jgi:hypothetical protein
MANIDSHRECLLIVAAFSRHTEALDWARERAKGSWGKIALESERFEHRETKYYEATMGANLKKTFFALESLIDPARLPELKIQAIGWEEEYKKLGKHPEARPLNLDPGYITEAKLVLASTKDRDHRLYLGQGIYGEVTLHFSRGAWQKREWTYPDYQREDYQRFFTECREYLRAKYQAAEK